MTTQTQINLVLENKFRIEYPVLEVGCKYYPGSRSGIRSFLNEGPYHGVDIEYGDNVDIVCDMSQPLNIVRSSMPESFYKTIICLSVLEHCKNPFQLAHNLCELLDTNGLLFVGAPFVWNIHGFPSDYWRFTPEGLKLLFEPLSLETKNSFYSTKIPGERIEFSRKLWENDYHGHQPSNFIERLTSRLFANRTKKYPYMLYPVDVNMVFFKSKSVAPTYA